MFKSLTTCLKTLTEVLCVYEGGAAQDPFPRNFYLEHVLNMHIHVLPAQLLSCNCASNRVLSDGRTSYPKVTRTSAQQKFTLDPRASRSVIHSVLASSP